MNVLLVEDDPAVRTSVARVLSRGHTGAGAAVAQAGSVKEAAAAVSRGSFDLAVVDLGLPDGHGTEVIRLLRAKQPGCVCVAFTVLEEPADVFEALRGGARGYLLKATAPARLAAMLEESLAGGAPMSPPIARLVVQSFEAGRGGPARLTARERDVLALLVKGLSYRQVGDALDVSLGTVQTHVKSIYEKLEVSSKAEATLVAVREGLV